MIVTVQPVDREEYALTLDGQPVYSSVVNMGYEQAQVPCQLDDEERIACLGGRLRIHGETGIAWQGIITRRPGRGEPLIARGWGWCATLNRDTYTASASDLFYSVFDNILDEIDTDYLPTGSGYRAWAVITTNNGRVEGLSFPSSDAHTKLVEVSALNPAEYGWYMERIAGQPTCVPHIDAYSSTPVYTIVLDRAESYDIDEGDMADLVSVVSVAYSSGGASAFYSHTDTDTSNPLVALGITVPQDVVSHCTSSAAVYNYALAYLTKYGRPQLRGRVTTKEVLTAEGADVYLPDVRPGQMARVLGLPDGYVDCVVNRVTLTGDTIAAIELDNAPYRLDVLLAQLSQAT